MAGILDPREYQALQGGIYSPDSDDAAMQMQARDMLRSRQQAMQMGLARMRNDGLSDAQADQQQPTGNPLTPISSLSQRQVASTPYYQGASNMVNGVASVAGGDVRNGLNGIADGAGQVASVPLTAAGLAAAPGATLGLMGLSALDDKYHDWVDKGHLPSDFDHPLYGEVPIRGKIHERINNRNIVYHATDLEGLQGILNEGHILVQGTPEPNAIRSSGTANGVSVSRVPSVTSVFKGGTTAKPVTLVLDADKLPPRTAPVVENGGNWNKTFDWDKGQSVVKDEAAYAKVMDEWKELAARQASILDGKYGGDWHQYFMGPEYKALDDEGRYYANHATLKLEQGKVPMTKDQWARSLELEDQMRALSNKYGSWDQMKPLEEEYRALTEDKYNQATLDARANARRMNKRFEYELRTPVAPIPADAIRGMLVNHEGLGEELRNRSRWADRGLELDDLRDHVLTLAGQHGIPTQEFANGREMFAHRAAIHKTPLRPTPGIAYRGSMPKSAKKLAAPAPEPIPPDDYDSLIEQPKWAPHDFDEESLWLPVEPKTW